MARSLLGSLLGTLLSVLFVLAAATELTLVSQPVTEPASALVRQQDNPAEPLARAHAHNDYLHTRPLFDALDNGFTSVEADIHLVGGELLVAHDPQDVVAGRTLRSLYLDPLARRVADNGGSVHPGADAPFQLLIDIKTEGVSTYIALDRQLRQYSAMLSRYSTGRVHEGAVVAVVSGNRPRALMAAQRHRLAFYDGRILDPTDLGPGDDSALTPLVSDNWTNVFSWAGDGPMPADEQARLDEIVAESHEAGQRVRFWATPDEQGAPRESVWQALCDAGVDHINTDDLVGLADFLRSRTAEGMSCGSPSVLGLDPETGL